MAVASDRKRFAVDRSYFSDLPWLPEQLSNTGVGGSEFHRKYRLCWLEGLFQMPPEHL